MGSSERFHVALTGRIGDGLGLDAVKEALAARTGLAPERVDELFERAPVVIRKDLDADEARAYVAMVEDGTGALCEVVPVEVPAASEPAAGPSTVAEVDSPPAADAAGVADGAPASPRTVEPGATRGGEPPVAGVSAGRGWAWIAGGFRSFGRNPLAWFGILVVGAIATIGSLVVPLVNVFAPNLLPPVLLGGLMVGCHVQAQGGRLRVRHLFAGFSGRIGGLLGVGVAGMLLGLAVTLALVAVFIFAFGGMAMIDRVGTEGWQSLSSPDAIAHLRGAAVLGLAGSVAMLPIAMLLWFAPALIVLGGTKVVASLRLSLVGCLRNWLPFTVYGVIWLLIGLLPVGVAVLNPISGAVLAVLLLPVIVPAAIGSIYASYRDIYPDALPPPGTSAWV